MHIVQHVFHAAKKCFTKVGKYDSEKIIGTQFMGHPILSVIPFRSVVSPTLINHILAECEIHGQVLGTI